MVAPLRTGKGSHAEESAEVEVLFANMEKMQGLTRKIQGSLNRLDASGKTVQEAVGPIYGNTQRLQTMNNNIERIIDAIDRIQAPRDQTNREERIILAGPRKGNLQDYIASLDRSTQTLSELQRSNIRANQQAISNLSKTIQHGTAELKKVFRDILRDASAQPVDALEYAAKRMAFPIIPSDMASTLRLIHQHISQSSAQLARNGEPHTVRIYSEIRGEYCMSMLHGLAVGTLSTARKVNADALYKRGDNGIEMYATAIEGVITAEYDSICPIFNRNEWGPAINSTCQATLGDFAKTLRELNGHIQKNMLTDCFLGYEVVEIVSKLSVRLESKTGELKRPISDSVKPIRETSKASLGRLLDDTRTRVQNLVALPADGAAVPVTMDTMSRLQAMTSYIEPLASIMSSLGPNGWNTGSSSSVPTMKSFDVGADGNKLFADYATDTIDTLLQNLEGKSRTLLKGKSLQGVFLSNNIAIVLRMIQSSDLSPLLATLGARLETWRKKAAAMYMDAWREPSAYLLDVQYTNRSGRPHSGGGGGPGLDSTAIVKGLSSKDKDSIKDKFKNFNTSFEELVARHKSFKMEREVRTQLGHEVLSILEPLYHRFWDKYHEIDKGKGKYVKYDKNTLSSTLSSLA